VYEAERPTAEADELDSMRDVERLLLEASNAIQRVISERDALRLRVQTLEGDVASLRQRVTLMRDSYRRLTTEFVTQLRLLDNGVNEIFGEPGPPDTFPHSKEAG
jgi:hypothetical protein